MYNNAWSLKYCLDSSNSKEVKIDEIINEAIIKKNNFIRSKRSYRVKNIFKKIFP